MYLQSGVYMYYHDIELDWMMLNQIRSCSKLSIVISWYDRVWCVANLTLCKTVSASIIKYPSFKIGTRAQPPSELASCHGSKSPLQTRGWPDWVERFDRRGTEPFELFGSKFGPQFSQNLRNFCQNSSEIVKFKESWPFSKIFREMPINFHQNLWKCPWKLLKNSDFA